jgi:hypothetical protein
MQHLEVSCAVRPIYGSLGAKGLVGKFHDAASIAEFMSDNSERKTSKELGSLSSQNDSEISWTSRRGVRQRFLIASSDGLWDHANLISLLCCSRASVARDDPFPQLMVSTLGSVISRNVYNNATWHLHSVNLTFNLLKPTGYGLHH